MKYLLTLILAASGVGALWTHWTARYTFAHDMSKGSNNKAIGPENAGRLNNSLTHGRWAATAAGLAALYAAWKLR